MRLDIHKKIAALFGYELVKISAKKYIDIENHISALIRLLNINCVLDVGANVGQFGCMLRSIDYSDKIISFEPVADCLGELKSVQDDNWSVFEYALGSQSGRQKINVTHKTVYSSLLHPNAYSGHRLHRSAQVENIQEIEIRRLDDIFSELPVPAESNIFLKIDTQGYDLEVLKGAENTIQHVKGLMTEVSCIPIYENMPGHIETLQYIRDLGFDITHIFPISHDKQDMRLLEFDCVFRRRGSV